VRALTLLSVVLIAVPALGQKPDDGKMTEGSADYSRTLKLVLEHKHKTLDFKTLEKRVVALKLPPHPQGDLYVMAPVPQPPPGMKFDPASMPSDWVGTWGEVAMTFWRGALSEKDYDALHAAAHGKLPGFPNCKPAR